MATQQDQNIFLTLFGQRGSYIPYNIGPGRDAPNMLKNLPIIPSRTSQNLSLLFFKIPPIIPKLFRSDSKKITAIAN